MTRYYNKTNGTEAVPGVHSIDPPDVIELPEGNVFWQPIPPGKQLVFDADNVPTGYEDAPPPENQLPAEIIEALEILQSNGVGMGAMIAGHYLERSTGQSSLFDAVDAEIQQVAAQAGADYTGLVKAMAGAYWVD
jgi:hypothetical protein